MIPIQNYAFNPPDLTVPAGTTLTWVNSDPEKHDVVPSDPNFSLDPNFISPPIDPGAPARAVIVGTLGPALAPRAAAFTLEHVVALDRRCRDRERRHGLALDFISAAPEQTPLVPGQRVLLLAGCPKLGCTPDRCKNPVHWKFPIDARKRVDLSSAGGPRDASLDDALSVLATAALHD